MIEGLRFETRLGVNPFKYGFIGGTDNHNGVPSDVAEDDFIGSHGPADATVERRRTGDVGGWIAGKDLNPGSIAGVWATQNTRAAIWDAMKAKETYTNEIGSAELMGSWTDLEFDPVRGALYHARVLEIPTPRFTTYDAVRNGLPLLENTPATIQERAWSSPIWYAPK